MATTPWPQPAVPVLILMARAVMTSCLVVPALTHSAAAKATITWKAVPVPIPFSATQAMTQSSGSSPICWATILMLVSEATDWKSRGPRNRTFSALLAMAARWRSTTSQLARRATKQRPRALNPCSSFPPTVPTRSYLKTASELQSAALWSICAKKATNS